MKSFDGWQRMLAFCILLVYGTMLLPAQEIYLSRQLGGMYLEQYLDRADLERSQQRWQQLADQGVLVALSAWESAHLYLLEQDPAAWEKQRLEAQQMLQQETQLRLAQWLLQSYMSQQGKTFFQTLSTRLQEEASLWQYQSPQGDSAPTRQVDGTQAAQAQSQWIASNQDLIHQLLEEAALADSELEEQLTDLELADSLRQELVREAAEDYRNYLSAEYDLILRSETSQLMGNLLYDRESLRAVSGQQSADVLAQELIQEAKHNTDIAVGELFASFQQEIHEDQQNQIQLQPQNEEWAQDFQRQLEEGLEIWNRTEEEFLRRRSQWEQEAVSTYEESQEAWFSAFQKIRAARQEWETEILEEFQTGMDEWSKSQQQQELEIQAAQQELALSLEEEVMRKSQLATVSVQIYNQVRSLLASCHQGVESWYGRWAEKYHKVYSYWKTEDAERYNQLFGEGQLMGLQEALEASEQNKLRMDMNLQELSGHESRTKIEMQVDQWKAGYLEYFREELRDAQATITNKIEEYQQELSKPFQLKEKEIRKQMDECTANRRLLQVVLADLAKVDSSTTASEIASLLNTQFVLNHTGLSFDSSLWESSEILLNQDTGWLVLSDAGLKSLEETTKSLLEAFDPNSLDGSSSELDAELQRLETQLSYWQDELAVAEALKNYATTTTSSAETAAETQREMEQADLEQRQASEEYEMQRQLVTLAQQELHNALDTVTEIQKQLDEVEIRITEITGQLLVLDEVEAGLDKAVVESQLARILDNLRKKFSKETAMVLDEWAESYFLREIEIGNESFEASILELLDNLSHNFFDMTEEQLVEGSQLCNKIMDVLEKIAFELPGYSSDQSEAPQDAEVQLSQEIIVSLKNLVSQTQVYPDMASIVQDLETLIQGLEQGGIQQTQLDVEVLIQQLSSLGSAYQDELLYRQEAALYLCGEEPASWSQGEQEETASIRRKLIEETYGHLNLSALNERHHRSLQEIQGLIRSRNMWSLGSWESLVVMVEDFWQAAQGLHDGVESAIYRLLETILIHWCVQNPVPKDSFLSAEYQEKVHIRSQAVTEVKELLTLLRTTESSITNRDAFTTFLNSSLFDTFDSDAQQQLVAYSKMLEEMSDQPSGAFDLTSIKSILSDKEKILEKEAFLLNYDGLRDTLLHQQGQWDFQNSLLGCEGIDGGSILLPDEWLAASELLTPGVFTSLQLEQLKSFGKKWIALVNGFEKSPYKYQQEVQDDGQLTGGTGEMQEQVVQNPLKKSALDIFSLFDLSSIASSLEEPLHFYKVFDSQLEELQRQKAQLNELWSQEENVRKEIAREYQSQITLINERREVYQQTVEKEQLLHQNFLQSRLQLRIAQEKYQWASRIYLESLAHHSLDENQLYNSPLQRYNDMVLMVERHQKALDILTQMKSHQQLQSPEYIQNLDLYDQSLENHYLMQVVANKMVDAVLQQEEATRRAEFQDLANGEKLFRDYESLLEQQSQMAASTVGVESPAVELIRIHRNELGEYTFDLGYYTSLQKMEDMEEYVTELKDDAGLLDKDMLLEYLTHKSEEIKQVDGSLYLSRAEVEVRQWLKDIHSKGTHYQNLLLLASLHLKTYSEHHEALLDGQADLRDEDTFQADQLPEIRKFHSVDVRGRYNSERVSIVANAYNHVMSMAGGEEDLARYILYRETNLMDKDKLLQREKAAIEWLALDEVRDLLARRQNSKIIEAAVAYGLAASLTAAAAFFQPWLLVAAAAAMAVGIVATDAAICFGETKDGVGSLMGGKRNIVINEENRFSGLIGNLIAGEKELQEEWKALNFLYYGNEDGQQDDNPTWNEIIDVLEMVFSRNGLMSRHEIQELISPERTDALSLDEPLMITDILHLVGQDIDGELSIASNNLTATTENLELQSQAAMAEFYRTLGQSVTIAEEDLQRLAELEAQATDESLATAQRQAALIEYNALYQSLHTMDGSSQAQLVSFATRAFGNQGWDSLAHKKNVYNSGKSLYNTRVDLSTETELYTVWLQNLLSQQAAAGWQEGASQVMDQTQLQWDLERELLARRRQLWEGEVTETLAAGRSSWQRMEEKLNKEYTLWRRRFQKELEERQEEWESSYLEYLQEKEAWVQESHRQALTQGVVANAELPPSVSTKALEERAARLSRSMESGVSHQMATTTVEAILGEADLQRHIDRSATMASLGRSAAMGIKRVHRGASSLENHLVVREQVSRNSQLMKRLAGRQAADYGQELLEQILEGYMEGIDRQNQAMVEWQEHLAWNAGYSVDGDIRRTVVVDATLMNPIRETQHLPVYQHFRTTAPRLRSLDAGSEKNAMTQLGLAQQELELWGRSILGDKGLFAEHRGAAPELAGTPDPSGSKRAAFRDLGSGQMGAILVEYYWNSIQARKGMAELSKPGHDKRLFDDRGLPFTAPTLREVSEIAMNIVGSALGQEWLKYVDDVVFAGIDLGGGYKTAGEIGREVAIKAAGVAIGAGTNWAGDIAGTALAESGKAVNFLVQGSISGGGAYLGGVATNYIAGGDGGWADAGNLAGFAGGFVSGGLGGVNLRDGNGIKLSDKVFDVEGISAMNGLAGGLASTVVNFGMTGNATFNLASIKGVGLLEVTLGKDGISSRLGSGGMSLSLETLTAASRGRQEAGKVMDWKYGTDESRSTLNGINQLGYTEKDLAINVSKEIWEGKRNIEYEEMSTGFLGRTDGNTIYISDKLLGGGIEGSGQLASLIDHEYTHILGGDEFIARLSGYDTYNILSDKFSLTGTGFDDITDISYFSSILKNEGEEGVFSELFFTDAFSDTNDRNKYYFVKTSDPGWRQTDINNKNITLGEGWAKDKVNEYNAQMLKDKWNQYKADKYNEYKEQVGNDALSETEYDGYEYKTQEEFNAALKADRLLKENQKLKNYQFSEVHFYDLYSAGCTLSTAAYISYSLTGKLLSLNEANEIAKQNDIFVLDTSDNQKNLLPYGTGFAKLINTLSGQQVVQYETSFENNLSENLLKYDKSDTGYIAALRVVTKNGNAHSVMLESMNYGYSLTGYGLQKVIESGNWSDSEKLLAMGDSFSRDGLDGILFTEKESILSLNTTDPAYGSEIYQLDKVKRVDIYHVLSNEPRNYEVSLLNKFLLSEKAKSEKLFISGGTR